MILDLTIFYMTLQVQTTKEKKDKLDFIQIKNFYALKDTIKRVKTIYKKGEARPSGADL